MFFVEDDFKEAAKLNEWNEIWWATQVNPKGCQAPSSALQKALSPIVNISWKEFVKWLLNKIGAKLYDKIRIKMLPN